jgi:hypothetical protein
VAATASLDASVGSRVMILLHARPAQLSSSCPPLTFAFWYCPEEGDIVDGAVTVVHHGRSHFLRVFPPHSLPLQGSARTGLGGEGLVRGSASPLSLVV